MGWLSDESGLEKCDANYVPLTVLSHLKRAMDVFPNHEALIDRGTRYTYAQMGDRVTRLASALSSAGIKPGDVVATLLPNIAASVEAGWAIPACGAILNTINTRLEQETVSYILHHGDAKALIVDSAFLELAETAAATLETPPMIIEAPDVPAGFAASGRHQTYENLIVQGDPGFKWHMPQDEWESLALNYTSGTTGHPKGVVYHHRGAYLMTMGTIVSWRMVLYPRYLTIVPLFHCNGWCHSWMMPLVAGTIICCRDVLAKEIYASIAQEKVTHFGGAPIVLNTLINAPESDRTTFDHTVEVFTAGAPPPAATLAAIEPLGFNVTQVYGLTETYGHVTECLWHHDAWDDLPQDERATIKARTGIAMPMLEDAVVCDDTMSPVPRNAETTGEVMLRGNTVMKGYYKNPEATREAFAGGYFRSGDVAFRHPDGYIKLTDRSKDIIISGGENVSSVEVESVLMHHPDVSLCAVVAKPDDKWGEVPCAFIEVHADTAPTESEVIAFCRSHLAGFKTPKNVIITALPKTSTGKIQKFVLRDLAKQMGSGQS